MKNVLIIGCGLLGSSLLRRIHKKKIAGKVFIYEKSKAHIYQINKMKLKGIIVKNLGDAVKNCDLIIANDVSKKDFGFNKDFNKISIIDVSGKVQAISKNKKSYIASRITKSIIKKFLINDKNIN